MSSTVATVVIDGVEREVQPLDFYVAANGQHLTLVLPEGPANTHRFWHLTDEIAIKDREKFVKGRCFMGLPTIHCEVHFGRCQSHVWR